MLHNRVLAICITIIGAATGASAQDCEYIAWGCQGPAAPHPQATWPGIQVQPPAAAPPVDTGFERQYRPVPPPIDPGFQRQYGALYARVDGEPFPVPAIRSSDIDSAFVRTAVHYPTNEVPGTIIIDPANRFLYFVQGGGRAIRYGIGVGRQGFEWSGTANIRDKQEWPDWYPPKEMLQRQPELMRQMRELRGGLGMPGGPRNPLGARALYLWQGNKDTLYRIHGTFEPWTIGRNVSSGCIRMINQDVIDLYQRAPVGAKVVVLSSRVG